MRFKGSHLTNSVWEELNDSPGTLESDAITDYLNACQPGSTLGVSAGDIVGLYFLAKNNAPFTSTGGEKVTITQSAATAFLKSLHPSSLILKNAEPLGNLSKFRTCCPGD